MSYIDDIKALEHPLKVEDMVRLSLNYVPYDYRSRPWMFPGLDHGCSLLDSEEQLCSYMSAYGEMHTLKLRSLLRSFNFVELQDKIEIIDWGCGQGLASVVIIDALRTYNKLSLLKKVTLIEPSGYALDRAYANVQAALKQRANTSVRDGVIIELVKKFLPVDNDFGKGSSVFNSDNSSGSDSIPDTSSNQNSSSSSDSNSNPSSSSIHNPNSGSNPHLSFDSSSNSCPNPSSPSNDSSNPSSSSCSTYASISSSTEADSKSIASLHIEYPICIHLFSNILDIEGIDLKQLANLLSGSGYSHYILSVGPANSGNTRLAAFKNYFHIDEHFCHIRDYQHGQISNGKTYSCCAEGYKVVRQEGKPILIPIAFYPAVHFAAAYRCDCIKDRIDQGWYEYDVKNTPKETSSEDEDNVLELTQASPIDSDGILPTPSDYDVESSVGEIITSELYSETETNQDSDGETISNNITPSEDSVTPSQSPEDTSSQSPYNSPSLKVTIDQLPASGAVFDVLAPFDFGASIYDDPHPVLAILNNMVCRGIPTRCSPMLETALMRNFGATGIKRKYGSFSFLVSNQDKYLQHRRELIGIPLGVARIQKTVLEAMLIGKIDLHAPKLNILVKEVDYPCAALALTELALMMDHLCMMSKEYRELRFPKFNLTVISERFPNSGLHHIVSEDFDLDRELEQASQPTHNQNPNTGDSSSHLNSASGSTAQANLSSNSASVSISDIDFNLDSITGSDSNSITDSSSNSPASNSATDSTSPSSDNPSLNQNSANYTYHPSSSQTVSSRGDTVRVCSRATQADKETEYDLVIDIAIEEYSSADAVQFSEFRAKNHCYFNVRSSRLSSVERVVLTTDRIDYLPVTQVNQRGEHSAVEDTCGHLRYFLRMLYRKEEFRPGQLPILNHALQNKSVIGLLPTGGGKSLTYQLAALLQPGVTVVIDPLKSLMQDQFHGLLSNGIDCCAFINSELSNDERRGAERKLELSELLIVFISPERLCINAFRERLRNMQQTGVYFSYGVIDEVHCVSEWGQEFRFSYLHLGRNLYNYVLPKGQGKHISLFGLTATASFDVLADVERELTGNGKFPIDPEAVVRYENSNRLELQYKIERIPISFVRDHPYYWDDIFDSSLPLPVKPGESKDFTEKKGIFLGGYLFKIPGYINELLQEESLDRIRDLFQERESLESRPEDDLDISMAEGYLKKQDAYSDAGIIFCPHVGLHSRSGISVMGGVDRLKSVCEVGYFHGGNVDSMDQPIDNDSMHNMDLFRENKLPVMVATKAFGMGIDKPNVRFTINMNYSSSLEAYVQEAGRGGRDRRMALSVILMSDYELLSIPKSYPSTQFPLQELKGRWFYRRDLKKILDFYNVPFPRESDLEICNPMSDLVQLRCPNHDGKDFSQLWKCHRCKMASDCDMQHLPDHFKKGYFHLSELEKYARQNRLNIPKDRYKYQSPDFNVMMFFYDQSFKGLLYAKTQIAQILLKIPIQYSVFNRSVKIGPTRAGNGIIEAVNSLEVGQRAVIYLNYTKTTFADISKAIYRMCIIGLITDFTQEYGPNGSGKFRIVAPKRAPGSYYNSLRDYLMRYYSEDQADYEVERASTMKVGKQWPEVYRCVKYLTEFIYDKIATKRRRAIDDMRNFCMIGINSEEDWKVVNEDLKDEIYYYFNSKYAREGYKTDAGEEFSLIDDTDKGKVSSWDTLFKYMRVVDSDVVGSSGSSIDSLKHLQGAVRLIRRGETQVTIRPGLDVGNGALCLLGVYTFVGLGLTKTEAHRNRLEEYFREGYLAFKHSSSSAEEFYQNMERFFNEFNRSGGCVATPEDMKYIRDLLPYNELLDKDDWLEDFAKMYGENDGGNDGEADKGKDEK